MVFLDGKQGFAVDQSGDFIRQASVGATGNCALLIDGENVASSHAAAILGKNPEHHAVRRVYGDVARLNGWTKVPELRVIHAPEGRNSADILLTIDAMTMAATGIRDFVIVTADGGLVHLVRRLREAGCRVVVMADDRASATLRTASHAFVNLASPLSDPETTPTLTSSPSAEADLDRGVVAFVAASKKDGVTVNAIHKFACAAYPKNVNSCADVQKWLHWLGDRQKVFHVDPPGPTARVRLAVHAPSIPTP
ncbi:MAG: NYN domain-containing protein [Gemmobacter sp.]